MGLVDEASLYGKGFLDAKISHQIEFGIFGKRSFRLNTLASGDLATAG